MKTKMPRVDRKTKLIALLGFGVILAGLVFQIIKGVNAWFVTHEFKFNKVVQVEFNKPIEIVKREIAIEKIIQIINEAPLPGNLTDIEKYICEKWGAYECKVALAVAKAESGMREQAVGINSNSIDVGIFQINSVHFTKEGCSLKDLVDAKKNVDCAYSIWEAQGWTPWVAFNSGAFKGKL